MLYNVTTGYGGVKKVPNANIVLLVSSVHEVEKRGIPFCFTSGHAYPAYADYYNSTADLDQIDWALLQRRDFSLDANDPGKKDRYQAEALVHHHLPLEGLLGMACYDEEVKKWIESELQARSIEMKVLALPRYYF